MSENQSALKEIIQGMVVIFGGVIAFTIVLGVLAHLSTGGKPLEPSFEVVDTYKGCEVVRYAPHQVAEYKYFLFCENNK